MAMRQFEFPPVLEEIRTGLRSVQSKTRQQTALRLMQIATELFPRVGTITGSRKKADQCYAVPRDILYALVQSVYDREHYLQQLVDIGLDADRLGR